MQLYKSKQSCTYCPCPHDGGCLSKSQREPLFVNVVQRAPASGTTLEAQDHFSCRLVAISIITKGICSESVSPTLISDSKLAFVHAFKLHCHFINCNNFSKIPSHWTLVVCPFKIGRIFQFKYSSLLGRSEMRISLKLQGPVVI